MSGPKTTWENLSNLGWFKEQIYRKLDAERGQTMEGYGDMALNEGFATDFGWYSYNALHGEPRVEGQSVDSVSNSTIVWTYDNTKNNEPFGPVQWTESWTDSETATVSIAKRCSIEVETEITILSVASSSISISISSESEKTETKEKSRELSNTWDITVGPHELVSIERVKTDRTGQATYLQDFGLAEGSYIGTKGKKYADHYYWGMGLNYVLNNPQGTMRLNGYSLDEAFSFKIIRQGPDGQRRTEPLPPPPEQEIKAIPSCVVGQDPIPVKIAGPE